MEDLPEGFSSTTVTVTDTLESKMDTEEVKIAPSGSEETKETPKKLKTKKKIRCCISTCSNSHLTEKEGLIFFPFPHSEARAREWTVIIGDPNLKIDYRRTKICSDHFREEDYATDELSSALLPEFRDQNPNKKKRLSKEAVPSLFLPPTAIVNGVMPENDFIFEVGIAEPSTEEKIASLEDDGVCMNVFVHDAKSVTSDLPSLAGLDESPYEILTRDQLTVTTTHIPQASEPCLVCSAPDVKINLQLHEIKSSKGSPLLNQQLWCTFVLRDLLKLPHWKYEDILQQAGSSINPSEWFVVCSSCTETVNSILKIQDQIVSLDLKLQKLKESFKSKCDENVRIDEALCKEANIATGIMNIRNEIRICLKDPRYVPISDPKTESVDFEDYELGEDSHISVSSADLSFDMPSSLPPADESQYPASDDENDDQLSSISRDPDDHPLEDAGANDMSGSDEEWLPSLTREPPKKKAKITKILQPEKDPLAESEDNSDDEDDFLPANEEVELVDSDDDDEESERKRTHSKKGGSFKCKICPRTCNGPKSYEKHLKFHSQSMKIHKGAFDCVICKVPYMTKMSLRVHIRLAHNSTLHDSWVPDNPQERYIYNQKTKGEVLKRLKMEAFDNESELNYHCKTCPRKYSSKLLLERHTRRHEKSKEVHEGRLDCFECKAPYDSIKSLRQHLLVLHRLVLEKSWDGNSPQQDHVTKATKKINHPRPFEIVEVVEKRKKKKTTTDNEDSDDDGDAYSCTRCDRKFQSVSAYEIHVKFHKETPDDLHCSECQRPYSTQQLLKRHLRYIHKISEFKCEKCGLDTKNQGGLTEHMTKHILYDNSVDLSISKTHFVCTVCKRLFETRRRLSLHRVATHADELGLKVFKCPEENCTCAFLRNSGLTEHIGNHHKKIVRYQCEQCGYGTLTKYKLASHMQSHEPNPSYMCPYCPQKYCYRSGIEDHMKNVHPEHFIPKRINFFRGVDVDKLEKEQGIVTSLPMGTVGFTKARKQFPCKYCHDTVFEQKYELTNHLKTTHSDMYSHQCDLCERVYMTDQSLQLHKKINHAESTATCGWCLRSYSHRIKLYHHSKTCRMRPKGDNVPKIFVLEEKDNQVKSRNRKPVESASTS